VAHADTADSADTANTANTATQAQNASTANGVRPVKVNFASNPVTALTTVFEQGGLRIRSSCDSSTVFLIDHTADNAALKFDKVDADGGPDQVATDLDWDSFETISFGLSGTPPNNAVSLLVLYRSAGGTTVSGELLVAKGAAAASCLVTGTLFVG
jgi:hypothetical protein